MKESILISILTPTYKRNSFLKLLANLICLQKYDLSRTEWIIVDDSDSSYYKKEVSPQQWLSFHPVKHRLHTIVYKTNEIHMELGRKRNYMKSLAKGNIIIQMDDDDYYGPQYIALVIKTFKLNSNIQVVGASKLHIIYPNSPFIWQIGPFHNNHTCGSLLSYRKTYALKNNYNNSLRFAEESSFLNKYTTPIKQLALTYSDYFAIAHNQNTVDKTNIKRFQLPAYWISYVTNQDAICFYHHVLSYSTIPKGIYSGYWNTIQTIFKVFIKFMYIANTFLYQGLTNYIRH